jgi:hypothetical protein
MDGASARSSAAPGAPSPSTYEDVSADVECAPRHRIVKRRVFREDALTEVDERFSAFVRG